MEESHPAVLTETFKTDLIDFDQGFLDSSCDKVLATETFYSLSSAYIDIVEDIWSVSNHMIRGEIEGLESGVKNQTDGELGDDLNLTKEINFDGFTGNDSGENAGSVNLNLLNALRDSFEEGLRVSQRFRRGSNFLKSIWLSSFLNSDDKSKGNMSLTERDQSKGKFDPVRRLSFDTPTSGVVTRSKGKAIDLPNVQPRILERKKSKVGLNE